MNDCFEKNVQCVEFASANEPINLSIALRARVGLGSLASPPSRGHQSALRFKLAFFSDLGRRMV